MKNIVIKNIKTSISKDEFVFHIEGIISNVDNIVLEGTFNNMHVYNMKENIIVLLDFKDNTGTIPTIMIGKNNKNFKDFLESLLMKHTYKVQGNILKIKEVDNQFPFSKDLLNKFVLDVKAIDDLSDNQIFDENIVKLYNYNIRKAYNLIKKNTNYLDNILINDIKDIKFSLTKDIIILLKNGKVILNGKEFIDNIKLLVFMSGLSIFSISKNNVITCLTGNDISYKFINNNNCEYKKILITPLVMVALTTNKDIKVFGTICDQIIDYKLYFDIDDIGYIENNDDIIVIKNEKVYSLFHQYDYSHKKPNILIEGSNNDVEII